MVRRHTSQRITGSWVMVTGKRREFDLLITLHDARPALPSGYTRAAETGRFQILHMEDP